ncbi:MAG TPA: GAF domain-containing protein [Candidatus Limnocylindrales bacterium]|nr:GAF domain-containing protein [Candidatus Limnocylindrales bacterium]
MGQLPDLQQARRRLGLALSALRHDRWVLGFLRGGCMQPIAASEISRRSLQSRPLMPLSRRALFEKRPVVINTVFERHEPPNESDWELDWRAILYVPVGELDRRPIGLLVIGCRSDHWYTEDDVAYAATLGFSLGPLVAALRGPLGHLSETETEVAHLLSHGLSIQEIGRAMHIDERYARTLVETVTRKFQSVSPDDLRFPAIQMKRMTW